MGTVDLHQGTILCRFTLEFYQDNQHSSNTSAINSLHSHVQIDTLVKSTNYNTCSFSFSNLIKCISGDINSNPHSGHHHLSIESQAGYVPKDSPCRQFQCLVFDWSKTTTIIKQNKENKISPQLQAALARTLKVVHEAIYVTLNILIPNSEYVLLENPPSTDFNINKHTNHNDGQKFVDYKKNSQV